MAHSYTPGLKVVEKAVIRKNRILPLKGNVIVKENEFVNSDRIVAKTELPGKVHPIKIINKLGISAGRIKDYMLKKEGETINKNEPLADSKPWLKFLKVTCYSPITGKVETISTTTGQVMLRENPRLVQIHAYIDGKVVKIMDEEGIIIETLATFIQGIFGIGGEAIGELVIPIDKPSDVLTPNDINDSFRDKIVVVGAYIDHETLKKAIEVGIKGVIVGGFDDRILKDILGYDIGVAVTGTEDIGTTIVITEGFGKITIAQKTFDLLKLRKGAKTSINGATQIRAGVVRPEIIIPFIDKIGSDSSSTNKTNYQEEPTGLKPGDTIRIIRKPHFGKIGVVNKLPSEPQVIETESKMRILEVKFPDGSVAIVPRSNVEAIEQ